MSVDDNKSVVRRVVDDVFSGRDIDAIDRYYAEDWVLRDPPGNMGNDRAAWKKVFRVIHDGFPDASARIDLILATDDLVAYRITWSGTHTREYFGVAPTRKRVSFHEIYIERIRDGKIVETWFETFAQGFYHQLTGLPTPSRAIRPSSAPG